MDNIKNIIEFRIVGDGIENEDGELEMFTHVNSLTKIHLYCGGTLLYFQGTTYDNDDGSFSTDDLAMPIEELRKLNKVLIENGVKII